MGLTQRDLANSIGVSLPTIKRWYGGGTITLDSLKELVDAVGLTLTEVFSSLEESPSKTFHYTSEQESFFSEHPDHLAYFDNLLRGQTPSQIQRKFHVSDKNTARFLAKLDRLNLIEWLPKNKIRLLVEGEPAWKPGGELAGKLRSDILKSFLEKEQKKDSHFLLHDYAPEDQEEITRKIQELIEFSKRANSRAKFRSSNTKPAGLYISLQSFRWDIDKYLTRS